MVISNRKLIWMGVVGAILIVGLEKQHRRDIERIKEEKSTYIEPPSKGNMTKKVQNYDFESGTFNYYTDEEIRMMRERESYKSEGTYIYTPARHVPSREGEIENYLEDNPGVLEELHDKYRD